MAVMTHSLGVRAPAVSATRSRLLSPGWPVVALFGGWPIWWALGLSWAAYAVLAIPMTVTLVTRRSIVVPKGFGLWLLFVLWAVVGAVALNVHAPGTDFGSLSGRVAAYTHRIGNLVAATILFVYICNLPAHALTMRRMARVLGWFFVVCVAGGWLGVLFPHGGFTSPAGYLLPHSVTSNSFVSDVVNPIFAQNQQVLGYSSPRPAAPFTYTNEWGANMSFLLPFFIVGWVLQGRTWQRLAAPLVLVASLVPIVVSLNRGLWLALTLSVVYIAGWLAIRGRVWALQGLVAMLAVAAIVLVATPLNGIVADRFAHGHSNGRRVYLATTALQGASASPILGWGAPRNAQGTDNSIAAGSSPSCHSCGVPDIGTHGLLYLIAFSNGIPGVALFLSFFAAAWWRLRRYGQPFVVAAALITALVPVEMLYYSLLAMPLNVVLAVIAVAWRQTRPDALPGAGAAPVPQARSATALS
jgi:O-Antigen ligase